MKSIHLNPTLERADILRAKRRYGFWFGISIGFGFSVFTWGIDAYLGSMHHALLPWTKFLVGGFLCTATGAIAGWLSARVNKASYAVLFWLGAAFVFARLTLIVPLQIFPQVVSAMEPATSGLLHYVYHPEFGTRFMLAYIWNGIFIALAGLLQLPMSESATFSSSLMGKLNPILASLILMGISGTIVDNSLINEPLRSAVMATDATIQFVVDNQGREADKAEARRVHAGAFRAIADSVTQQRRLIVSRYDEQLGEIHVLVRFENAWAECLVLYSQPASCKLVEGLE